VIVVDASIAVQWIAGEADSGYSESVLSAVGLVAPEFLLVEVANALRRKVSAGDVDMEQAKDGLLLISTKVTLLPLQHEWICRALAMAAEMAHPIYDCVYLALAEREAALLATRDREFIARTTRLGLGHLIRPLPSDG
jgi:predicted nucleic acid-binding protein